MQMTFTAVTEEQKKTRRICSDPAWRLRQTCTDLLTELRGFEAKPQLQISLLGAGLHSFVVARDKTEVKHSVLLLLLVNQQQFIWPLHRESGPEAVSLRLSELFAAADSVSLSCPDQKVNPTNYFHCRTE